MTCLEKKFSETWLVIYQTNQHEQYNNNIRQIFKYFNFKCKNIGIFYLSLSLLILTFSPTLTVKIPMKYWSSRHLLWHGIQVSRYFAQKIQTASFIRNAFSEAVNLAHNPKISVQCIHSTIRTSTETGQALFGGKAEGPHCTL